MPKPLSKTAAKRQAHRESYLFHPDPDVWFLVARGAFQSDRLTYADASRELAAWRAGRVRELMGETGAGLRSRIEIEQDAELWGRKHRITPRLVPEKIGDGAKLIWFETMDVRPAFWVLQVESTWDLNNLDSDKLEQIEAAILDHFGPCLCDDSPDILEPATEEERTACGFPVLHNGSGGCAWGAYDLSSDR